MAVVEVLDGLFEADGDEESEDDGGDVDEEVAPGAGGVVGWVDVEHGDGLRWSLWRLRDLGLGWNWFVFRHCLRMCGCHLTGLLWRFRLMLKQ
jgi:hypothetical protein